MVVAVGRPGPRVGVLAYDGMSAFELGIVTEVFGLPRPELDVDWYDLTICAITPGASVPMVGRATMSTPYGLDVLVQADTVIVPGVSDVLTDVPPALVRTLQQAHGRGARLVSICSGAFALAAAGLLDGRRAATHWRYAELLARRFPAVTVDADVLYVDGGDVLTSAGSAAGLDLCLHIVRTDFGAAVANAVARRLVIQPHRAGGQKQFIDRPVAPTADDDRVVASMQWALSNLDRPVTVAQLAARAHMSARSYLRHFRQCTGTSPIRWLIERRVQASLALLEASDAGIDEIATATGFATSTTFRHHFSRTMCTSPTAYRRAFRDLRPAPASSTHDAERPGGQRADRSPKP